MYFLDPNPKGTKGVLLLHGLGANSSSWSLQFEPLIDCGFRPIAPDMPGFGASPYDGSGWSFKIIASNLANLINDLNLRSVHVVGLSMGGVIAQQFALDYPFLVQKIALVSTFSELRPASFSQWIYFATRAVVVHTTGLASQSKIVSRRVFPEPGQEYLRKVAEEQISSADPRAYRAAMRSLAF